MFAGMSVAYWFLPLEILYFNLSLRPPALILTMSVLNALSLKREKKGILLLKWHLQSFNKERPFRAAEKQH